MTYTSKKAFILIGASGSGKSTVVKELTKKYPTAVVYSLDNCRHDFFATYGGSNHGILLAEEQYRLAYDFGIDNPDTFTEFTAAKWTESLDADIVIVDNVNGTRKSRARWVDGLRKKKFNITMVEVQTPLDVILARQSTRGDKNVPAEAVKTQFLRQESAMVGSECDNVILVNGTKPWRLS